MTVAALQIALKKVCARRSADNAPIVNTRHAMRQRKIGFDALELGFSEPKIIGSPASLKRKLRRKEKSP